MNFITWLENNEYDQWRSQIDNIANRDFAFASWFPADGRVYLPFKTNDDYYDEDVEDALKHYGYSIQDYRQGLATDKSGRIFKIGRILDKILKQKIQDINNKLQFNQISPYKAKAEMTSINNYFNDVKQTFQNSSLRADKQNSQYEVVISSNPHDIASMSTGRDWASCMELGKGAHYKDVFCEVGKGGFIAYLIRANDKDIKKPLARILIRRFDNKKGQSVAIPEQSVYGNPIEGFQEIVNQWIESKQGTIKSGYYRRKGGEYSDTFERKHFVINKESDIIKLLNIFDDTMKDKEGYDKTAFDKLNLAFKAFFNQDKQWSPDLINFIDQFLKKYINKFGNTIPYYAKDFVLKYPEYADEQLLKVTSAYDKEKISDKNPKFAEIYKSQLENKVLNKLNINLLVNKGEENKGQFSLNYKDIDEVNKILNGLRVLKKLKEPIVQKIIQFGEDFIEHYKEELPLRYKKSPIPGREQNTPHMAILKSLIYTLHMGEADTPIVIDFYKKLLPFYERITPNIFNSTLAQLGRNGVPFLPFLRNKLEELEKDENPKYPEMLEKQKENLRYTIDSIENGKGRSDRYEFNY